MKHTFEELYKTVGKSWELDSWSKMTGIKGFSIELGKEAAEVREAVEKKDYDNLMDELGDVLIDWTSLCLALEKEKGEKFDAKSIIQNAIDKLHRRQPYLKENRKVTAKEAKRLWNAAKEKEKAKTDLDKDLTESDTM